MQPADLRDRHNVTVVGRHWNRGNGRSRSSPSHVDVSREQKTAVLEFAAESLRASGPSLRDEVLRPVEDDALMKRL
jgi:hypothetical protein